jgi:hypothetical protein
MCPNGNREVTRAVRDEGALTGKRQGKAFRNIAGVRIRPAGAEATQA